MMIASVMLATGCNTVLLGMYGEDNQTFDAFKQRVEAVFQLQNSMTSDIMLRESELPADIVQGEVAMRSACASLNEAGVREMEGRDIGVALGRRVEKTLVDCEKAAKLLQHRLEQFN